MTAQTMFDSKKTAPSAGGFDFHHAITLKERSSRYLRTAIDYLEREQGREACDAFLKEIGLPRESSVFKHIHDDENWNSYALEVYLYDRLKDRFDDPFEAIWNFGVASGSGHLDQKDTLFAFRIKVAPVPLIVKKASEHTEKMSLISECTARMLTKAEIKGAGRLGAALHFNYVRLPEGFEYPHWTSVVAGYGIVQGLFAIRKGLKDVTLTITHWPNLPSDLPSFQGKKYLFDKKTKNVVEAESGAVVGNARQGPFEIDGIVFNNAREAICTFEYRPESLGTRIARATWQRPRIKREKEMREFKDRLISELSLEHQAQLGRYERELSEKMEEIRQLKVQQDGDYFLTSLLTKPLIANRNVSETVGTEFILHQKKKFEFRNRQSDLGGDICVTDRIELFGRSYVVFANGDAMGKSMQGAGGALVLGVVLQAFLSRTHFSHHQRRKVPELWLRDCYFELQNVFLSFNGSMYLSLVMGLIDEVNGTMFYLNAEHPGTILLRDGHASFLDANLLLRKLGTPGEEDKVSIRLFQLLPGDVVIAGSDGRDDLEIGQSDDGSRIINEDETLFLRIAEEAGGQLDGIVRLLEQRGGFTDDLSLLRVSYRVGEGEGPRVGSDAFQQSTRNLSDLVREGKLEQALSLCQELVRDYPEEVEAHGFHGRLLFKLKRYAEAAEALAKFCEAAPADTESFHVLSLSLKKSGDPAHALENAERTCLRDPVHIPYILNQADCYRLLGKIGRAREVMDRARELDAEHVQVRKMMELLAAEPATR